VKREATGEKIKEEQGQRQEQRKYHGFKWCVCVVCSSNFIYFEA
jgi:hypothetical protein